MSLALLLLMGMVLFNTLTFRSLQAEVPLIEQIGVSPQAHATFNFRLLPGDTLEVIQEHLKKWINDERISLQVIQYQAPSPVSGDDTWGYGRLDKTIREVFPNTVVSPNLVIGATDARYFHEISDKVYRFAPYHLTPETVSMFHGINERISVEDFDNAIRFYVRLMENMGEADN